MDNDSKPKKKRRSREEQIADIRAAQALDLKRAEARIAAEEGRKHLNARDYTKAASSFKTAAQHAEQLVVATKPKPDVTADAASESDSQEATAAE